MSSVAVAQDDEDADEPAPAAQQRDDTVDEVVVTGSRLKRDTYSSISPLQIITSEASREVGVIDPGTILQESTSSAGAQADLTFSGLVQENGPHARTIDLRGLGASRTLVMINGRRAAPAGVEGAPVSPDLNLVPGSLVERYEILLDAASSVYGSDAIAGVSNIILRKDFDGFEFETYSSLPEEDNGIQHTASIGWGYTGDRGFFGIAGEYTEAEAISMADRPWTEGCEKHMEITESGEIRSLGVEYQALYGMQTSPCKVGFGRRAWDNNGLFGSIYWTPGTSNVGIPNLSEATMWNVVLDQNGDGQPDVDFLDYNASEASTAISHMSPDYESAAVMAYGEYTFPGEANITPYFEANWNEREVYQFIPGRFLGKEVPANNPYNLCNPNGVNGVDCGQAYTDLLTDPGFEADFGAEWAWLCAQFGFGQAQCTPSLFGLPTGPLGPLPLEAQINVIGDRGESWTTVAQTRLVVGVTGDMPYMDFAGFDDWSFDVSLVHSDATGEALRQGISEERLDHSLNTTVMDPVTGAITCGNGSDGCVPINLFAPSLYAGLIENDFATQAERDYVFARREFDTDYMQTLFSAYANGDWFSLPGGNAMLGVGFEYRTDEIKSIPNDVARDGLLWGYFADGGATGEKFTREFLIETELPLFAGYKGMEELTLNLSTRYTKDEFYGGAWTYSAKLAYRPVSSLLLRGTVGTAYRAPNLRENFMLGQTGFRSLFDPCVPPEQSIGPGGYDPAQDDREQHVIDNCIANGVDPASVGVLASGATTPVYSVEVAALGQQGLDEEKSDSFTAGFAFEQPWWEAFDMTIGATYYEVEMRDEIMRLHGQYSINDCYEDFEGDSAFCGFIERDPGTQLLDFITEEFLNQDSRKARGIDWNLTIDWPTQVFGRAVDFNLDINMNKKLEFSDIFVNPFDGSELDRDDYVGEFGFPEWNGIGRLRADMGKWRFTWSTRYISSVAQDPAGVDAFSDVFGSADTCLGLPDDELCRDYAEAKGYYRHDMSVYYYGDVWSVGVGVRNVQNEWPPQIDSSEVGFVWNNTPMGRGYDVMGRTAFVNIRADFE